jgi:hypothetical protein
MKKIIIIFIIVICLLSFVGASCLAQDSKFWNHLKDIDKTIYVMGIRQGVWMCIKQFADAAPNQYTNKKNEAKLYAFLKDAGNFINLFLTGDMEKSADIIESLVKVMDDLYKDPANSYIPITNMCLIASRKLRGEPIESLLQEARKEALQ